MRAVATLVPVYQVRTLGPRLSTAVCWPLNEVAAVQPAHCGMKLQVCCR